MTREEALRKLEEPIYDPEQFRRDKQFVLAKLRLSEEEFERIMRLPVRSHEEFGSDQWVYGLFGWIDKWVNRGLRVLRLKK